MWVRNALFLSVCLLGLALVAQTLLVRDRIDAPRAIKEEGAPALPGTKQTSGQAADDSQATLEALNGEFQEWWKERKLEPAPPADDLAIARRLSLALVGTVPSLEEIRALEGVHPNERQAWWINHLLQDRRFSDYWAERLARIYVGNEKGPFLVFRRRRFTMWLSDELFDNTPYDQIVRSLISEEGIWTGKPAANFVTAVADPNKENQPDPIRLAGRTARAFLGMRIDCLQCHDDKLGNVLVGSPEDIHSGTQATFHELAAFFGPTEITLLGVREGSQPYQYKYLHATAEKVIAPDVPFGDDYLDGHGKRRAQLARWVTHTNNKAFARATVNRVWALLFGKPLVEPIDDIPLVGSYPPSLQLLADDFASHGYDLARLIRLIAASDVFARDSKADFEISAEHERQWAVFPLSRLRPEQMAASVIQTASLTTIDGQAHVISQIAKFGQTQDFVERYGGLGEDEFTDHGSTIPQRLLLMNGKLVKERTDNNPVNSAAARISMLTGSAEKQVEAAYLAILTRRPTDEETRYFANRLSDRKDRNRAQAMEDLCWTLINSTEFSWNH